MRAVLSSTLIILCACSSGEEPAAPKESSNVDIFFNAMFDELRGQPSREALALHAQFDEGGVGFKYPQPLRVRVDREGYTSWSLERGDFELELYLADHEIAVSDYLETLVGILASDKEPVEGPLDGRTVRWCERELTGVLYRFVFLGERHVIEGFDLPPGSSGSRYLIFNDIRGQSDWSDTAAATFDAVNASIECRIENPKIGPSPG
jgi:hypothetical protein